MIRGDYMSKIRIAHLSGDQATIQNTPPLVTSSKARTRRGLPPIAGERFDALRPQRLAAPAKVYVEQFSALPLEADAADLYGPPDGYLAADGTVSRERRNAADKPVYEIELKPEDGLYPLPYMALQKDGSAWEDDFPKPETTITRQPFFPDGSRSFEEIDRLSVGMEGHASLISSVADVDYYRVSPPGGYTKGLSAKARTDIGTGDIPPEERGRNFFPYRPYHLFTSPPRPMLAKITNDVQAIMASGRYDGAIWTQSSSAVEEASYWMSLLIDTPLPIACNSAQRPQGQISNDGPINIVDSVNYIRSRVWADSSGRNKLGVVAIQDRQIFAARELTKVDARAGGYIASGGHGGILGQFSHANVISLMYLPAYKHTYLSEVNVTRIPETAPAIRLDSTGARRVDLTLKDKNGRLIENAIPSVAIVKDGTYCGEEYGNDAAAEADLDFLVKHKLRTGRLVGFIAEGITPYGKLPCEARTMILEQAIFTGVPVVRVARGNPEGFSDLDPIFISGQNLNAIKARLLLMAALMRLGSLPTAADPAKPTAAEIAATENAVAAYQQIFNTH
jgi:L-asparaginase